MLASRVACLPYFDDDVVMTTMPLAPTTAERDWRNGLPALTGSLITLRELRISDAPALFEALTTQEVARFISPPPTTVEGFEKFIEWTHRQRAAGHHVCFAVVPRGADLAIGLFQVRALDDPFETAEWGFALASEYWGTGVFVDGARLVVSFTFETLGVRRLEARAAAMNGRGNGALLKIGAVREAVMRRSFHRGGKRLDQALWTILADDWRQTTLASGPRSVH